MHLLIVSRRVAPMDASTYPSSPGAGPRGLPRRVGPVMRRILAFAVCGLSLGACTSGDLFRLDTSQTTVRLESEPPGADAKLSTGPSCKTPCALPVEGAGEFTVTYTLEGYQPQEVAVQVLPPLDPREGPARVNPNPVQVQLEAAARRPGRRPAAKKPAAKPAPKKPAAKRPAATRPAPAAAPEPAPAAAAPPPAASPSSPWPPAPGQPQQ